MTRQFDLGKQQLWLERVQRWRRSHLTIRDFCLRHLLGEPSFYAWKRILGERGLLSAGGAATTPPRTAARPTTPLFVAATLADSDAAPQPLEVVLADGLAVRVRAGF